jgi:hypothetical protein
MQKISDEELEVILETLQGELRWSFHEKSQTIHVLDNFGFFKPFTKKQWWKCVEGPYRIMKQNKPTTTVEGVVLIFLKEYSYFYTCYN